MSFALAVTPKLVSTILPKRPILCHTKSMINEPTDAMLEWIEEQMLIEWEAEMNEEPLEQLSTTA